ncbi:hypothetical protein CKO31_05285 [Thiohalocapsa halophila]|uniref:VWFA domain-containing protein n=1 Tax=Thiohalocapsa halophila TaxID=69359 RepID=A0ABS1CE32_9GAMM|nr:VWA domain-containing protein [Thiohalocapsa halophila]MBK1630164.1 hypothetical protein [Thiohalocapsa halophila]
MRFSPDAVHRWGMRAVAALLLLALWSPPLPRGGEPAVLTLLLDDSASLRQGDAEASWQSLRRRLRGLPENSRVTLIRFAARPAVELREAAPRLGLPDILPRQTQLSPLGTDLAGALAQAPQGAPVLLVSDGRGTTAGTARALAELQARVPAVAWWRRPAAVPNIRIATMDGPARVPMGSPVRLRLVLTAERPAQTRLSLDIDDSQALHRPVSVPADAPTVIELELPPPAPGVHRVRARLGDPPAADTTPGALHLTKLLRVEGAQSVLLVGTEDHGLASALRAGGWSVEQRTPERLLTADLAGAAVTLLDDVPVAALSPPLLERLANAVNGRGMGLVVLGGPRSFGAGGYRGSRLEALLPVVSVPPKRVPAASVLFALDSSGSMGQPLTEGVTRIDAARAAIMAAAAALAPQDRIALAVFGTEAELTLPLASYAEPSATLASAKRRTPAGGTHLAPAIDLAMTAFAERHEDAKGRRLLVLISDGQFADTPSADLTAEGRRLREAGVELIAIGIGEPSRTAPLRALATAANGRFARVDEAAQLPSFVATEVQRDRPAKRPGLVSAQPGTELPFRLPGNEPQDWPPVADYRRTRLRDGAAAPVITAEGDPLLAWQSAGQGRVVALTAGLGELAPAWRAWSYLPAVLGGLISWTAGAGQDPGVEVRARHDADRIRLHVDMLGRNGSWARTARLEWQLHGPQGGRHSGSLPASAPGRFVLDLSAPRPGRYDVIAHAGPARLKRALWHAPRAEWLRSAATQDALAALADLPRWTPVDDFPSGGRLGFTGATAGTRSRPWLAGAALLLFIGILARERLGRVPGEAWRPPWAGPRPKDPAREL